MSSVFKEFTKGLWSEIPPFRLVLGLCPTLAVTTTMENGLGMGLSATFVLVCSNVLISALRKIIPDEVRVACYVVVIATFVVCVEMITKAYFFQLSESLGLFIPLIVVNCIILGRAEAFARKNGVIASFADGLGMG
ncbi:electron transport complex subunit RsxE, partial [bacterium]|nr:electron transport complex subunit RsxE [bacterium]